MGRGLLAEGADTRALAGWGASLWVEVKEAREAWWLEEGGAVACEFREIVERERAAF